MPDGALVAAKESPGRAMSGVHGLNWFPSGPRVMERILDWMGFQRSGARAGESRRSSTAGSAASRCSPPASSGFFGSYDAALPDERARVRELISTTVPPRVTVAIVTPGLGAGRARGP